MSKYTGLLSLPLIVLLVILITSVFNNVSSYCINITCIVDKLQDHLLTLMPQDAIAQEASDDDGGEDDGGEDDGGEDDGGEDDGGEDDDGEDDGGEEPEDIQAEDADEEEAEAGEEPDEIGEEPDEIGEEPDEIGEEPDEIGESTALAPPPGEEPEDIELQPSPSIHNGGNGPIPRAEAETFTVYQNPFYGIKIQHPISWERSISNDYVGFISRDTSGIFEIFRSNSDTSPLVAFVSEKINSYKQTLLNFEFIESQSRSTTVAGAPAFIMIYNFRDPTIGMAKSMELVIKDTINTYTIVYTASPLDYSKDLPTIQRMVSSFRTIN
jgi:hypothetical protein